jgi:hypothetical protein
MDRVRAVHSVPSMVWLGACTQQPVLLMGYIPVWSTFVREILKPINGLYDLSTDWLA